mmetsp:Transcript_9747/g.16417  ORF Transcript_9747/g.16417 Transcript_9747/m.16417 type:complete len:242 (-) Transcript_9747:174-899(-)
MEWDGSGARYSKSGAHSHLIEHILAGDELFLVLAIYSLFLLLFFSLLFLVLAVIVGEVLVFLIETQLIHILLQLFPVLVCEGLGLVIVASVVGTFLRLAVAQRIAYHEVLAVLKEIGESIFGQVLQILNVLLVLRELEAHVHDEGAGDESKYDGPGVGEVFTHLERVDGQEAVPGVVGVDEVVGEEPELEPEVVKHSPEDESQDGGHNEEDQQVETYVPDALLQPHWPEAEAHEGEDHDDH